MGSSDAQEPHKHVTTLGIQTWKSRRLQRSRCGRAAGKHQGSQIYGTEVQASPSKVRMQVDPPPPRPSDSFPDLGSGGICINVRINVSWKKPRPGNMIDVILFGISLHGFTGACVKTCPNQPGKKPRNSFSNMEQDVTGGLCDAT